MASSVFESRAFRTARGACGRSLSIGVSGGRPAAVRPLPPLLAPPHPEVLATFPAERELLAHERAAEAFPMAAYFAARTAVDVPTLAVLPTFFLAIALSTVTRS